MIVKNDFKVRQVTITTKRLILRPWKTTDLLNYHKFAGVSGVGEMAGWKSHRSVNESKHVINKMISHNTGLAVTLKGTDIIIGCVKLERVNAVRNKGEDADKQEVMSTGRRCAQINLTLSTNMRGVGLGHETVHALLKWLEEYRKMQILFADIRKDNEAGIRVFKKSKFEQFDEIAAVDLNEKPIRLLRFARINQESILEKK